MNILIKTKKIVISVFSDFFRFFIVNLPGPSGRKIRYIYYKRRFRTCGSNVLIDEGVIIQNPEWISIGSNVWIDKHTILIAGPANLKGNIIKKRENNKYKWDEGELRIGSGVHIGAFNIIQAHGGVNIGDKVTTSASVKIYSLSNSPRDEENPELVTYANYLVGGYPVAYRISPIVIEEGVWIALNCVVLASTIGKNSFIATNSVVISDILENSYARGYPAKRVTDRFNLGSQNG